MKRLSVPAVVLAILLVVAACTTAATPTPGATPTTGPATASSTPTSAATPVAAVPEDQLILAGNLFACIDIPYPPQEAFDENGTPIGSDIDIAIEIGHRLGLTIDTGHIENTVFQVIIPALTGGKCDIIVSAQNINADRLEQVDMVPYFKAGQSVVVAAADPRAFASKDDLCGKIVAVQSGTTELDFLQGTSDYEGDGLNKACLDGGKAAITVKEFAKDNDALLALQSGTADAYFADSPAAGYYVTQHPQQFKLSGLTLEVAIEGISVAKTNTGLRDGVKAALLSMINDGKYLEILTKWGIQDGAVTAAEVNAQQ